MKQNDTLCHLACGICWPRRIINHLVDKKKLRNSSAFWQRHVLSKLQSHSHCALNSSQLYWALSFLGVYQNTDFLYVSYEMFKDLSSLNHQLPKGIVFHCLGCHNPIEEPLRVWISHVSIRVMVYCSRYETKCQFETLTLQDWNCTRARFHGISKRENFTSDLSFFEYFHLRYLAGSNGAYA